MPKKERLKHTEESIKRDLWNLYEDEYKLRSFKSGGEFVVQHVCGREYSTSYDTLIKKKCRCKVCSNLYKKTAEEFQRELDKLHPDTYRITGEYQSSETRLMVAWIDCKHQYPRLPRTLLNGGKCPKCSGKEKKNTAMFIQEVQELEGDTYTVTGEYVNSNTPIMIKHNPCGNTYPVYRKDFLKGKQRCKCSKEDSKRTRWNTESFTKKVQELAGEEYVIMSPYVTSNTYIDFLHVECGEISPITPGKFLSGNRCRYCKGNLGFNHEWFIQEVKELVGDEYIVLSNYQSMHRPVTMKHVVCNEEIAVEPNNFLRMNTRCKICSGNQKKSTEEFKKEVLALVGEEYEVISDYITTDDYIAIKHNICGEINDDVTPANFLRGRRCPRCSGKAPKTTEMFRNEVFDLVGGEYEVLGQYVDADTHIKMLHKSCEYEYPVVPYSFLAGARCPSCNESKGEKRIIDHIKMRNLPYEKGFKILGNLSLDVAVFDPKHSDKVLAVFEFQGMQHYEPVAIFGGLEKFQRQIRNDQKKRRYCMVNGINLIIIPYWNYEEIEKIIDKHI